MTPSPRDTVQPNASRTRWLVFDRQTGKSISIHTYRSAADQHACRANRVHRAQVAA